MINRIIKRCLRTLDEIKINRYEDNKRYCFIKECLNQELQKNKNRADAIRKWTPQNKYSKESAEDATTIT